MNPYFDETCINCEKHLRNARKLAGISGEYETQCNQGVPVNANLKGVVPEVCRPQPRKESLSVTQVEIINVEEDDSGSDNYNEEERALSSVSPAQTACSHINGDHQEQGNSGKVNIDANCSSFAYQTEGASTVVDHVASFLQACADSVPPFSVDDCEDENGMDGGSNHPPPPVRIDDLLIQPLQSSDCVSPLPSSSTTPTMSPSSFAPPLQLSLCISSPSSPQSMASSLPLPLNLNQSSSAPSASSASSLTISSPISSSSPPSRTTLSLPAVAVSPPSSSSPSYSPLRVKARKSGKLIDKSPKTLVSAGTRNVISFPYKRPSVSECKRPSLSISPISSPDIKKMVFNKPRANAQVKRPTAPTRSDGSVSKPNKIRKNSRAKTLPDGNGLPVSSDRFAQLPPDSWADRHFQMVSNTFVANAVQTLECSSDWRDRGWEGQIVQNPEDKISKERHQGEHDDEGTTETTQLRTPANQRSSPLSLAWSSPSSTFIRLPAERSPNPPTNLASEVSPAADATKYWFCQSCNLHNLHNETTCIMCDTSRSA